ncbi:hypothetical protein [Marilutibacter chinensis]|uniref:Large polyvalent protein associated domain-containing protein n=1 Tax=Marilutibacter chinensis TaxID=2912247 RepID=A0ABS9HQU8_9GAMM|nr:hypothetical protein [Lysobacter chinensis]MCF7220871.1 hypothetical protein [Lysobacter chinensis]
MSEPVPRAAHNPAWLDDETLAAVRPQVRRLLESSQGFRELPVAEQQELARNMVRVASYMSNPDGLARQELTPGRGVLAKDEAPQGGLARALAGEVDAAKRKASEKVGTFAGSDFEAGSVEQGATNFRKYIGAVDFPAFVGGLIQNVFQAIVDASIQQMRAYGELLKSVSQTVDQFASDNISLNNARDWLVDRFPGDFRIETGSDGFDEGAGPRIALVNEDNAQEVMGRVNQEMQMAKPVTDLSDPEQEGRLAQAARMQMARSRQQLLSSMVILGINRIVITDGAINAKVVFDFRASDQAQRSAAASLYDRDTSYNRNTTVAGAHFGWGGAATANTNVQTHMTTVSSSVDEESESKQEMKAKLTGEVRVNFKSDYFPMEKLASPAMIAAIQGNSTPIDPNYVPSTRNAAAGSGG